MKIKRPYGLLFVVFFYAVTVCAGEPDRPNIIFILADDLGYGDLSSYGAKDIATPNIDRLAREGVRFTDHYTPANTCSPTRAALMTGRYQARTGVNAVIFYDSPEGLPQEEITMAEILRDAGYATGMIGKWHLGNPSEYMPWNQGFDEYFGVSTSNDDKNFFLYESAGTKHHRFPGAVDQTVLTQQYNQYALQFLEKHANAEQPFFLYFAHTEPHVPLHPNPKFLGKSKRGIFGDAVMEVDDSVGQLLNKLDELGIADNTLVVFSSDNGAWLTMRDWGGSNGILREGKLTAFEGGHRVPALARWPQQIPTGIVNTDMATIMDWFVTFAHYAHATVPEDRVIDGRDLSVVLENTGKRVQEPFYYFALRPPHEDQSYLLAAVREGKWRYAVPQRGYYPKLFEPLMKVGLYHHGELLFDLERDPGETDNVIDQYPDVAAHMRQLIADFKAHNNIRPPILIQAVDEDNGGWGKLWYGIVETLAVFLLGIGMLVFTGIKLIKTLIRNLRN